ncbi:MAG: tetratricopeptide repeat protein [Bacteroidetes bacterium]|nr:tetratricopeptide repeat protein [Bacteroidota bacterium]
MHKLFSYTASAILFLLAFHVNGQEEKKTLRNGNQSYFGGKTMEAANYYRKSAAANNNYHKANFNLGDALYKTALGIKEKKIQSPDPKMTPDSAANLIFDQAADQFEIVAKSVASPDTVQKAWHNYGNARLMQKNYEDAISAYKKSLKIKPDDEDTRYNLAYALTQLKKQQQNQNKDNKNDKQNKENQKQEDKQKVNNKDDKDQQNAAQPQMNKEQAEQMLNALKNAERKLQANRKKSNESGSTTKPDKDW